MKIASAIVSSTSAPEKNNSRQRFAACNKKKYKNIQQIQAVRSTRFTNTACKSKLISFIPQEMNPKPQVNEYSVSELNLIDTTKGCVIFDEEGNEICILVPPRNCSFCKKQE